jgi:hypothetical protein
MIRRIEENSSDNLPQPLLKKEGRKNRKGNLLPFLKGGWEGLNDSLQVISSNRSLQEEKKSLNIKFKQRRNRTWEKGVW